MSPPKMILKHGKPEASWASPLCTRYSMARTTAKSPRDLEDSDKFVQKVLDLAEYFGVPFFMGKTHTVAF